MINEVSKNCGYGMVLKSIYEQLKEELDTPLTRSEIGFRQDFCAAYEAEVLESTDARDQLD